MNSTAALPDASCRRKVARRLLPFLCAAYVIAYIDRANVAFANLYISADLHFSPAVFGFGAGVFFLGYFLLEIPGAIIVERWSARRWIARILVSWGVCTILTALIRTPAQFCWARFFIGCAEAGFYPGVIVYLTHWFIERDRARAAAIFVMAAPVSLMIAAPLSTLILHAPWRAIAPWRWLFVIEGVPAVVLGVVALYYLTDHPRDAMWLSEKERQALAEALHEESRSKGPDNPAWWRALTQWNVVILATAHFLANMAGYAFIFWLPANLRQGTTLPPVVAELCSGMPFSAAAIALWFTARSSDKTGERKAHAYVPMLVGAAGIALTAIPHLSDAGVLALLTLTGAAAFAWIPGFWMLPSLTLSRDAAAASIGFINAIGNLGGFAGPFVTGLLRAHLSPRGTSALVVASAYVGAAILTSLVAVPRNRRDAGPRALQVDVCGGE